MVARGERALALAVPCFFPPSFFISPLPRFPLFSPPNLCSAFLTFRVSRKLCDDHSRALSAVRVLRVSWSWLRGTIRTGGGPWIARCLGVKEKKASADYISPTGSEIAAAILLARVPGGRENAETKDFVLLMARHRGATTWFAHGVSLEFIA